VTNIILFSRAYRALVMSIEKLYFTIKRIVSGGDILI